MAKIKITPSDISLGIEEQCDFTRGYGAFHIDGRRAIPNMNRINRSPAYGVTTIDWHPLNPKPHVSFAKWGVHCVPGTLGAQYDPDLYTANIMLEFKKGTDTDKDIYDSCDIPYFLDFVKIFDPGKIIVHGSAIPVCPSLTAMTLAKHFEVYLAWDACCLINSLTAEADILAHKKELERAGVILVNTNDFNL